MATDTTSFMSSEQLEARYRRVADLRQFYNVLGTFRQKMYMTVPLFPENLEYSASELPQHEALTFADLQELGINLKNFVPLIDLGAFPLQTLRGGRVDFGKLKAFGISQLVLMEDRDPLFFLNYETFEPTAKVPLNRHGNSQVEWRMEDVRRLVEKIHAADMRVAIGFWGNTSKKNSNPFLQKNWQTLRPVVPMSDDVNPLTFVTDSAGNRVLFADFIVEQFGKLHHDFMFDGLFMGDGLFGFRSFLDAHGPYDFTDITELWTDFYQRVWTGIRKKSPHARLWTFDCMANGAERALQNGVSLETVTNFVDRYVFQSYGQDAWGQFMRLPGYTPERDAKELALVPEGLRAKTLYCMGLGDNVEGWYGTKDWITAKHGALAEYAGAGVLGVWSNALLRGIFDGMSP